MRESLESQINDMSGWREFFGGRTLIFNFKCNVFVGYLGDQDLYLHFDLSKLCSLFSPK